MKAVLQDAEPTDFFDMSGLTSLTNLTSLQLDGQNHDSSSPWVEYLQVSRITKRLCSTSAYALLSSTMVILPNLMVHIYIVCFFARLSLPLSFE